jgi:hypothetical protein
VAGPLLQRAGLESGVVTTDVITARNDWEHGYARLVDATRDAKARERLLAQVDAVTAELRRRLGGSFTLQELASTYADADRWTRVVVEDHAPAPGWAQTLSDVGDAAFHLYARGAIDYVP